MEEMNERWGVAVAVQASKLQLLRIRDAIEASRAQIVSTAGLIKGSALCLRACARLRRHSSGAPLQPRMTGRRPDQHARNAGAGIALVIFDHGYLPRLLETPTGP